MDIIIYFRWGDPSFLYIVSKNIPILILGANEAKNPLESWDYVYRQLECIGYTKDQGERPDVLDILSKVGMNPQHRKQLEQRLREQQHQNNSSNHQRQQQQHSRSSTPEQPPAKPSPTKMKSSRV